ncbi:MAG: HEAT repeat domain-containing protein [Planctomycetota bacterium]|jgi:HEAT repeat protein
MTVLCALLLLCSPETERLLLGPSPFFRHDGMERALREGDLALLGRAAASPHWDARRLAAQALGARAPASLLRDPVAVVRAAAVAALDSRADASQLLALLADPDDAVRAHVVWALRDAQVGSKLRGALKDPFVSVRVNAMAATGRHRELLRMARRDDLGLAVAALAALGRGGDASAAGVLLRRLQEAVAASKKQRFAFAHADASADYALARAVGEMARRGIVVGGRPVADKLQRLITKAELSGRAGVILAEAAAGARDAESARRVIDGQIRARKKSTLPFEAINFVFRGGMYAFAREPWPELAPLLLPLLAERDPIVRRAVATALHGDAARLTLRDKDAETRAIGCMRIGKQKPLLAMLQDDDPRVRSAAVRALGRIGDEEAGAAVTALDADPDAAVRRAVLGAILRLPVPKRVDRLYRIATQDRDPAVRASAAASFGFLEDRSVYGRAVADLRDENYETRKRAVELLRVLQPARFDYDPGKPEVGAAAWEAWWKSKSRGKQGGFRYHVEDLRRRGIDLVLVIDATGSMAPLIQATKRRLEAVVAGVQRVVPDLRVRVVFYRDRGDRFLTLASPLTHEVRLLEDFITAVPAGGGGDLAEAVLEGVRAATSGTPWRPKAQRIVILFGDAPPHPGDEALLERTIREFKGVVHTVDVTGYGRAASVPRGRSPHHAAFERIAQWGKGAFVHSGNDRELLREILVLTLGPEHRLAVEALFGL